MTDRAAVLVDYTSALDFCHPSLPASGSTRSVLNEINARSLQMDIRQACWSRLTESLSTAMKVYLHLRDEASRLLADEEEDSALNDYTTDVLTREELKAAGVSLDHPSAPELDDLRDAVEEMGLGEFRSYIDTQLRQCTRGQDRLDMLIDNRFSPGGEDPFIFEASMNGLFERRRVDFLTDAYVWAKSIDGYIFTRCDSDIHSKRKDIYDGMNGDRFEIVCPDEYGENGS